jgi:hypothetical protein
MADQREWTASAPAIGGWPAPAAAHLALNNLGGFDWDLDGGRLHLDPVALRVLDLDPEEFAGSPAALLSRLPPEEADGIDRALAVALKEGQSSWSVYFRVTRDDGHRGWIHARGRIVRDSAGRACRIIGIVSDANDEVAQAVDCVRREEAHPDSEHNLVVEVTASLSEAVTVRDVTAALTAHRRLDRLGIASLFLGMVEGGRIRVVSDAEVESWVPALEYTRLEDGFPMSEVVQTLEPRFITSVSEAVAAHRTAGGLRGRVSAADRPGQAHRGPGADLPAQVLLHPAGTQSADRAERKHCPEPAAGGPVRPGARHRAGPAERHAAAQHPAHPRGAARGALPLRAPGPGHRRRLVRRGGHARRPGGRHHRRRTGP